MFNRRCHGSTCFSHIMDLDQLYTYAVTIIIAKSAESSVAIPGFGMGCFLGLLYMYIVLHVFVHIPQRYLWACSLRKSRF